MRKFVSLKKSCTLHLIMKKVFTQTRFWHQPTPQTVGDTIRMLNT